MGAVSRLGETDFAGRRGFRAVAFEAAHAQARQAVFALAGDEEIGKEINLFDHHVVAVGNELGPVFAAGRGHRRGDQTEVAPAIVGADEPQAVAMIDGVFVLVLARAMSVNSPSGSAAGSTHDSVVMWLADSITMNLPSRVRPAPRLKRSSSSW